MDAVQAEILQRMTRVETTTESMNEKLDNAITVNKIAVEAHASASSAHKRLDKIERGQEWLWRTFAGAFILAIAAFVIAGGLK